MNKRELTTSAVAMVFAVVLGAAWNWLMFTIGFIGLFACIGVLCANAANISLLPYRRPRYDCDYCQDTGIQPGQDHGTLITLPTPCIHCKRGEEAGNRLADVIKNSGFGGLPWTEPSREEQVRVVVDFFEAWRFCPVSTATAPSKSCLEDAANQLLDALAGVTPER